MVKIILNQEEKDCVRDIGLKMTQRKEIKAWKINTSKHHLFTYHEIRDKLVEIFGEPTTNLGHIKLQREIRRIHNLVPTYVLPNDFHNKLHFEVKK